MGKTFLLIDDEPMILDVLQALLCEAGHTTIIAENAKDAKEIAQTQNPDIAIVDIMLPDQGGIELIMELKRKKTNLCFIIISGKVDMEKSVFHNLIGKFGVKAVLAKPFTTDELFDAVKKAL